MTVCQSRLIIALVVLVGLVPLGLGLRWWDNRMQQALLRQRGAQYDQSVYAGWHVGNWALGSVIDYFSYNGLRFAVMTGIVWGIFIPLFYLRPCLSGMIARPVLLYYGNSLGVTAVLWFAYYWRHRQQYAAEASQKRSRFDAFMDEQASS